MRSHLGLMDNARIACIIIIVYKNSVLPVIWASQDVANVIMIIVNTKVDLAIL